MTVCEYVACAAPPESATSHPPGSADSFDHVYDLFGVVVHKGTMDSGHYVAYVRVVDQWFLCDDAQVFEVAADEVG
jgi:ubiquitin carboxyl-terminal hydrolase 22/27/51